MLWHVQWGFAEKVTLLQQVSDHVIEFEVERNTTFCEIEHGTQTRLRLCDGDVWLRK